MSDAITAIGLGIGNAANLNTETESGSATQLILYMSMYLTLSDSWSKTLSVDETTYTADAMETVNSHDPQAAAVAAQAYAKYTNDETSQSTETGSIRTLIDNGQSLLRNEASSMETIYNIATPEGSLLTWSAGLLRS